jgi:hypothetical protein
MGFQTKNAHGAITPWACLHQFDDVPTMMPRPSPWVPAI